MSYLSFEYFAFVLATLAVYYAPTLLIQNQRACARVQGCVLLAASGYFYYRLSSPRELLLFAATILATYALGRLLSHARRRGNQALLQALFALSALVAAAPLLLVKITPWFEALRASLAASLIVPVGLSFYTLQLVAYLSDCRSGKTEAERNLLDFALFASFFPQIIQGPIPRHARLSGDLKARHPFRIDCVVGGMQLIVWGCFLKLMIADRLVGPVNLLFDSYERYPGTYVLIAGVLYSLQLYTDFYACVTLSQGVAEMLGIRLDDNFQRPYMATSIRDFWRRWHMSLSAWLRDYVYFPLGGSRKGKARTYVNLMLVFLVSGFWHGSSLSFLVWGLMHGLYQIAGRLTDPIRERLYGRLLLKRGVFAYNALKRIGNFIWVMLAWIVFRAENLRAALGMFKSLFTVYNPWALLSRDLFGFGLDAADWFVLLCALAVLIAVSALQEKGVRIRERLGEQHLLVRWTVYLVAICAIWVFGTYGFGFNAADFIYGGF